MRFYILCFGPDILGRERPILHFVYHDRMGQSWTEGNPGIMQPEHQGQRVLSAFALNGSIFGASAAVGDVTGGFGVRKATASTTHLLAPIVVSPASKRPSFLPDFSFRSCQDAIGSLQGLAYTTYGKW